MCLACQIKPPKIVQYNAPRSYFIPCGHCRECDEVYQKSWSFRLRVELEHLALQGWKIAFATLTYKDLCLPHMPPCVFREKIKYKSVQCFSRTDCTSFIHALRSYLWREYHLEGQMRLRYFLCSEFGSTTQRAHYHLVLAFPPCVDAQKLFNKIHRLWEPKGHVFPRYINGGCDSRGYFHKPFIVSSPAAAARYIAKYTTKDLYYFNHLQANDLSFSDFKTKLDIYRDCRQFHLGSRSLGLSILEGLTDEKKLDLLKYGYSFCGDSKLYTLPVYLKNRLIFDNVYQYKFTTPSCGQTGEDDILFYESKRIVRRDANLFFLEHFDEIFALKVKKYEKIFKMMSNPAEYRKRNIDVYLMRVSLRWYGILKARYSWSDKDCAEFYLAYYGVPFDRVCHEALSVAWLRHYVDIDLYTELFKFRGFVPITSEKHKFFHLVFSWMFSVFFGERKKYSETDKLLMRINDFFKSAA